MGVDCDTEEGRLQMRMKRNERRKRDFSLRRPTHCRSKCGRKSRPASFEMTVRGQVGMRKELEVQGEVVPFGVERLN